VRIGQAGRLSLEWGGEGGATVRQSWWGEHRDSETDSEICQVGGCFQGGKNVAWCCADSVTLMQAPANSEVGSNATLADWEGLRGSISGAAATLVKGGGNTGRRNLSTFGGDRQQEPRCSLPTSNLPILLPRHPLQHCL
jgi:hypothetical protein